MKSNDNLTRGVLAQISTEVDFPTFQQHRNVCVHARWLVHYINMESLITTPHHRESLITTPHQRKFDRNTPSPRKFDHYTPSQRKFDHNTPSQRKFDHYTPSQRKFDHNTPSQRKFDHNTPSQRKLPKLYLEKSSMSIFVFGGARLLPNSWKKFTSVAYKRVASKSIYEGLRRPKWSQFASEI